MYTIDLWSLYFQNSMTIWLELSRSHKQFINSLFFTIVPDSQTRCQLSNSNTAATQDFNPDSISLLIDQL